MLRKKLPISRERQELLEAAYDAAASDPEYVAEMLELAADFDVTVADGLEEEEGTADGGYPAG